MSRRRLVIAGAAGRDFHNFNAVYRGDPGCEVVAFTAAQITGIAGRRYPPSLAGPRYPQGIPIVAEEGLEALLRGRSVDEVVLSYSDLSHLEVMHLASRALAAGSDFSLLAPRRDARNLRGGERDDLAAGVAAVDRVEVVEIPSGGAGDDQAPAAHAAFFSSLRAACGAGANALVADCRNCCEDLIMSR